MKRTIKERWLAALRSGKYEQVAGKLKGKRYTHTDKPMGYCCLGVLLDVVEPDGWSTDVTGSIVHEKASNSVKTGGKNQYINPSFAHSLGIPAGLQKELGKMNDRGVPFSEIATIIETQIPTEDD